MTKQAKVKCLYCGQQFYREDVSFVQIGRRYAHKKCAEEVEQIHDFMRQVLGTTYSRTKIDSQIKQMIEKEGYTLTAIYNTLIYWYKIKKASADQANGGIGIVPWIYPEYIKYVQQQENIAAINKGKQIKDFLKTSKTVIGKAKPLTRPRHVRFYDLD